MTPTPEYCWYPRGETIFIICDLLFLFVLLFVDLLLNTMGFNLCKCSSLVSLGILLVDYFSTSVLFEEVFI